MTTAKQKYVIRVTVNGHSLFVSHYNSKWKTGMEVKIRKHAMEFTGKVVVDNIIRTLEQKNQEFQVTFTAEQVERVDVV